MVAGLPSAPLVAVRALARRLTLDRQLDFWMDQIAPTWSPGAIRARVVDVIAETHDVRTFVLAPNRRWPGHRAGQFVTVAVEIDGVRVERCYSLSSAPEDEHLAVTVKRVAGGRVSSWMHGHLRRGDVIGLGSPMGEFILATSTSPPPKVLLVSGGSGITPVMSILRDLSRNGAVDDVVFLHAARSPSDLVFGRELAQLATQHAGLRLVFVTGPLDRTALETHVLDLAERQAMLCGPPAMMEVLTPTWTERGLTRQLKVERFAPVARLAAPAGARPESVALTLLRSGRTVASASAGTLLEQLERGGERPPYGCRMGICNTCSCRKRSGVVENVVTGVVSGEPDEDIRLCISRARSDVELAL